MDRLTYRKPSGECAFKELSREGDIWPVELSLPIWAGALAEYEDTGLTPKEIRTLIAKAGTNVELPCKAGDELWTFCDVPAPTVYSLTALNVFWIDGVVTIKTDRLGTIRPDDFGKSVFYTKEEADEALKRRRRRLHIL